MNTRGRLQGSLFYLFSLLGGAALLTGCGGGSSSAPGTSCAASSGSSPSSGFQPISISGDNSPSGIYDPSILNDGCTVWMSYSSVDYHQQSGNLVQDVGVKLARSDDGGASFSYVTTLGTPQATTVHDTNSGDPVCGTATCSGRWVYETSWLIDDSGDPQPTRRYKLFAHKYFLYPPSAAAAKATHYELGSIVMWTAPSPDGAWSGETSLLGWDLTPPELVPQINVNTIDPALASCLVVAEGAASVRGSTLDFAFACPYLNASTIPQKIVLLRSTDHAASFSYVGTPLQAADAATFGADYFSAPSLLPRDDSAPVLFATPVKAGIYSGCVVFPFADENAGTLTRDQHGAPVMLKTILPLAGDFGGACAWDRGLDATGVLLNEANANATPIFSVYATQVMF